MRKLKQLCLATMLVLALSTFTMAGIITTPPAPEPPPPDSQSVTGITDTPPQSEAAPTDVEFALSIILQSVVTVF
jgi:hypothetical protein